MPIPETHGRRTSVPWPSISASAYACWPAAWRLYSFRSFSPSSTLGRGAVLDRDARGAVTAPPARLAARGHRRKRVAAPFRRRMPRLSVHAGRDRSDRLRLAVPRQMMASLLLAMAHVDDVASGGPLRSEEHT